jgi:hypothetical protein
VHPASAYYPPRAGALRSARSVWYWLRRTFHLENLAPATGTPPLPRLALQLLIPGLVCFDRGQTLPGRILLGLWLAAFALYWSEIGHTLSSAAFLLLTAVHSVCATMALREGRDNLAHPNRAALLASIFVFTFYTVFRMEISDRVVQPILVENNLRLLHTYGVKFTLPDQLVLVNPRAHVYHRGDWVLYSLSLFGGHLRGNGLGLDRILALPGETVQFHPESIEVGGTKYAKVRPDLPSAGSQKIPNGTYLIWPTSIVFPYDDPEENVPAANSHEIVNTAVLTPPANGTRLSYAARCSMVREESIIGKPYHRWFFHSRNLPPLSMLPPDPAPKSP